MGVSLATNRDAEMLFEVRLGPEAPIHNCPQAGDRVGMGPPLPCLRSNLIPESPS